MSILISIIIFFILNFFPFSATCYFCLCLLLLIHLCLMTLSCFFINGVFFKFNAKHCSCYLLEFLNYIVIVHWMSFQQVLNCLHNTLIMSRHCFRLTSGGSNLFLPKWLCNPFLKGLSFLGYTRKPRVVNKPLTGQNSDASPIPGDL